MRIRTIKPEFWTHPVMARLPDEIQLLALALLSAADDEGYFLADPAIVRGECMPFRDDLATISRSLAKLSEVRWIDIREHPEHGLIGYVRTWGAHQRVDHPRPSKIKAYFVRDNLATFSREHRAGTGNREQGNNTSSSTPPEPARPAEEEEDQEPNKQRPLHPDAWARLTAAWPELLARGTTPAGLEAFLNGKTGPDRLRAAAAFCEACADVKVHSPLKVAASRLRDGKVNPASVEKCRRALRRQTTAPPIPDPPRQVSAEEELRCLERLAASASGAPAAAARKRLEEIRKGKT